MFPPNSVIIDYAYSEQNPLRHGEFEVYEDYDELEEDGDMYNYEYGNNDFNDNDNDNDFNNDNVEINQRAIALFDFAPENDNEVALTEGQIILISYRHGQGWLVAEDPETGENGLVPEEYVEILNDEKTETPKPFLPEIFQSNIGHNETLEETESEWVDTDEEEQEHQVAELLDNLNDISLEKL